MKVDCFENLEYKTCLIYFRLSLFPTLFHDVCYYVILMPSVRNCKSIVMKMNEVVIKMHKFETVQSTVQIIQNK